MCQYDRINDTILKNEKQGRKRHTLLNSRARARVRIKKRNLANIRKNAVKIIRIIVGQGKESRNFPSDKIRALRFPVNSHDFRRNFCRRGYYVRNFDSNRVEIRILDEI